MKPPAAAAPSAAGGHGLARGDLARLVVLTLMWGMNWPMMKFSLRELSPLWFRALTMSGGTLTLLAFFAWRGVRLRPAPGEWRLLLPLALLNIVGWHTFSIIGLQALASGRAAILGFTMPVWTVLLGLAFTGQRLTPRLTLALAAAAAAVALLSAEEFGHLAGRPLAVLWMQLGALCWAGGTLLMRQARLSLAPEAITVLMMLVGSAGFGLAAPLLEPVPDWRRFTPGLWWSLAYGVFLNFGIAQVFWFGLTRRLPAAASAFSIMAVPLVGTLGATWVVGETPRWADGLAGLCIVAAIACALLPPRRAGDNPPP